MSFLSRRFLRSISAGVAAVIILEAVPWQAHAAPARDERAHVKAALSALADTVRADLKVLAQQGKEAYLDGLFARLSADETRAKEIVVREVKRIGAKPLGKRILGLGSPVLANVLSVIPESWQEKIVISTLTKFISKALREVREIVAGMNATALKRGLELLLKLVTDPRFAEGQALTGDSWWEKFFGNSTVVRNFLIVVVSLAAIGVAVGLAIAGSTVAPVVAVIGALVALIALLNNGFFGFAP
jgi:hypothetical protein